MLFSWLKELTMRNKQITIKNLKIRKDLDYLFNYNNINVPISQLSYNRLKIGNVHLLLSGSQVSSLPFYINNKDFYKVIFNIVYANRSMLI